jgi:aspartyl-tRNA(Asn)/glutamyl-tRNA(Gln) amidotransferase subunit A
MKIDAMAGLQKSHNAEIVDMTVLTRRHFSKAVVATATAFSLRASGFPGAATAGELDADQLAGLSLTEAAQRIRSGSVTSTQLTRACLERIQVYNPKVFAYITVLRDSALAHATQMDQEAKSGKYRGPLHGVPIALKDNIDTAGIRTTAASKVYDDRIPSEDAEVTRRLLAAGAVFIGKANLDEFADAVSYYGSVRNPWALDRDPSGSSSGSAAAVAVNLAYGALGTDTGGSIRLPSAYCGTVGIKPTYGLVPIRGIIPLAFSLDHCGPITRTVDDAALLLNQLAGYDRLDITSVKHEKEDYVAAAKQPTSGFRLGIPRAPFFDHLDDDTAQAVEGAIGVLAKLTKSMQDASLPSTNAYTWASLNSIGNEIYAYHEELFEMNASRYSLSLRLQLQQMKDDLNSRPASARVSQYIRHRADMELLRRTVDDSFADFDLVVLPTLRVVPQKLSYVLSQEESVAPRNPNMMDLDNCTPFNIYGLPAISIPCGFSRDNTPIGLMIAGPHFSEGKVLALARAYEQETKWDMRRPPLAPDTPVPPIRST